MDKKYKIPQVYKTTASELKLELRKLSTRHVIPDWPGKITRELKKSILQKDEIFVQVMKLLMIFLTALQELIPSLYDIHKEYELAEKRDIFTYSGSIRGTIEVIISRVESLETASKNLDKIMNEIALQKEVELENVEIRPNQESNELTWLENQRYISVNMRQMSAKSYKQILKLLSDIADTA